MSRLCLPGRTYFFYFPTTSSNGPGATLTGATVSVYSGGGGTKEFTTGVTLAADYDSRTGFNKVTVDMSDLTKYTFNDDYVLVLTAGTVNGVSVVPEVVGEFNTRIEYPAGVAQASTSSTLVLAAATSFADDTLNGQTVYIMTGTGAGQSRVITDYTGASDTADISPNWATTPDTTSTYLILPSAPAPTAAAGLPAVNVTHTAGVSGFAAIFTQALTESYSTDGGTKTAAQALYEITQYLHESSVSSTTLTVKKVDGSTSAYTLTLNDASTPTSKTRAT